MSLFTFLLSSRHHFLCVGNVQGVRDDILLHPEKNLSSSSFEQFGHSLHYLPGPPSQDICDDVILPNVISWELRLGFPVEGAYLVVFSSCFFSLFTVHKQLISTARTLLLLLLNFILILLLLLLLLIIIIIVVVVAVVIIIIKRLLNLMSS